MFSVAFSSDTMKYLIVLSFVLVISQQCATQSANTIKVHIDQITSEYLKTEKDLWKKIDTQQILVDRGILLGEIYREHKRILNDNFGDTTIISGFDGNRFQQLINIITSIDSNTNNIKKFLSNAEYGKLTELMKISITSFEKLTEDIFRVLDDKTYWNDILMNVNKKFFFML